jgi:hypothetical protein
MASLALWSTNGDRTPWLQEGWLSDFLRLILALLFAQPKSLPV